MNETDFVGVITPTKCKGSFPENYVLKLVSAAPGVLYIFQPQFAPASDEWGKQEKWKVEAKYCPEPMHAGACKAMSGFIELKTNTKTELGGSFDLQFDAKQFHWRSAWRAAYKQDLSKCVD